MQSVPYSIWDDTTPKGTKLLTAAHDRLMAFHANATRYNNSIQLPAGTASRYPTQAIVAMWDPAITWVSGGWSTFKVEVLPFLVLVCAPLALLGDLQCCLSLTLSDPLGTLGMFACLPKCNCAF